MASHTEIQECLRCGTCCQKGGPALHQADKALVDEGIIPANCLYTLRRGELAEDTIHGGLVALTTELIKLKGQKETWACLFFDASDGRCRIYDKRPLECRLLKCWDTRELERIYNDRRLTRRDLLEGVAGLWDMITDHEARCSYSVLKQQVRRLEGSHGDVALKVIVGAIRYDTELRQLVLEKGRLDSALLDFLFGRPLTETIKMFGLHLTKSDGKYTLTKKGLDYTMSLEVTKETANRKGIKNEQK